MSPHLSLYAAAVVFSLGSAVPARVDAQDQVRSSLEFGDWKSRESLRPFWSGIRKEWWATEARPELISYCREFAKKSAPEQLIPEMIEDLKADYSVVRHACYIQVALGWPREATLRALSPYYRGEDQVARALAGDFIADIEQSDAQQSEKVKDGLKQKAAQPGATDNPGDAQ